MTTEPKHCEFRRGFKVCLFEGARSGVQLIHADQDDRNVGEAVIERLSVSGQPAMFFSYIGTQKRGAGTAMYEFALSMACNEQLHLVSDVTRSPFAEAFWQKQVSKGRARCVKPNSRREHNHWATPMDELPHRITRECERKFLGDRKQIAACKRQTLLEHKEKLPKPAGRGAGRYWPCERYAVSQTHCSSGDLSGLHGPRRRR